MITVWEILLSNTQAGRRESRKKHLTTQRMTSFNLTLCRKYRSKFYQNVHLFHFRAWPTPPGKVAVAAAMVPTRKPRRRRRNRRQRGCRVSDIGRRASVEVGRVQNGQVIELFKVLVLARYTSPEGKEKLREKRVK